MSVTLIGVVVCLAIGAPVTLRRFGFPRSSRVVFLLVHLLGGELADLIRASVKSFALRGEVRRIRKLKETTANIIISKGVLRLKLVNDIVHATRKRHEKVGCFSFMGLWVLKEMAIG